MKLIKRNFTTIFSPRYLFDQGANLNLWDRDSLAPIAVAAYEGHTECVELLLSLGARLDILDRDDKTALFHAAEQAQPAVIDVSGRSQ